MSRTTSSKRPGRHLSTGSATSYGNPGGSSRERRDRDPRAILLLSMIILVWNLGTTDGLLSTPQVVSPGTGISPSGPARGVGAFASPGEPARRRHGNDPLTVRQSFLLGQRVDINRATYQEISGLPGISDDVARAVVEERKRRGAFRRTEDLLAVRGIKEKRLKKILPFIAIIDNN